MHLLTVEQRAGTTPKQAWIDLCESEQPFITEKARLLQQVKGTLEKMWLSDKKTNPQEVANLKSIIFSTFSSHFPQGTNPNTLMREYGEKRTSVANFGYSLMGWTDNVERNQKADQLLKFAQLINQMNSYDEIKQCLQEGKKQFSCQEIQQLIEQALGKLSECSLDFRTQFEVAWNNIFVKNAPLYCGEERITPEVICEVLGFSEKEGESPFLGGIPNSSSPSPSPSLSLN